MKLFTLPNLLTLSNLFCGSLAAIYIANSELHDALANTVLTLLCLSLLFDLLDGMVARALKINSEIGVQLDSLADMVSFGLVPGLMMMTMLRKETDVFPVILFGLLITLFSALRLAKFNLDTEQSTYFKGLATPANTILIYSLFWIVAQDKRIISPEIDLYLLLAITLISSVLLISNIPLFSFKFKGFGWKDNHYKYIFLLISLVLLIIYQIYALPYIILLYIITSILFKKNIIHA